MLCTFAAFQRLHELGRYNIANLNEQLPSVENTLFLGLETSAVMYLLYLVLYFIHRIKSSRSVL